jgi:hypothetical protein
LNFFLTERWASIPTKNLKVDGIFEILADTFFLKFDILEPSVIAVNSDFNSPVWQDSCVEFFCSFDEKHYYNFEINAIGAILGQYGKDRFHRNFLKPETLKKIGANSSLGIEPFGLRNEKTRWETEIVIPFSIFSKNEINHLNSLSFNVYKCADRSQQRHYMSLFNIESETPDFHRPEFFQKIN